MMASVRYISFQRVQSRKITNYFTVDESDNFYFQSPESEMLIQIKM